MGTTNVYYPHAIILPGPVTLTQITNVTPGHNFQDLVEFSAGQVGAQFTGTHQAAPDNRFTTSQLKSILDLCTDFNVAKDLSAGNVDVEFRAGVNLGTRTAAASLAHIRCRSQQNTILCWESLSAKQGQLAEMRCRLASVMNTVTGADPLTVVAGVAVTATPAIVGLYTLGPQKINGTFLTGVMDVSWDNQIGYEEITSDGDGFPTFIGVKRVLPRISITTTDLSVMNTFGTRGTALSALSSFFRKKLASGINVADGTAQHIGLAATTGTVKARQIEGSEPAMAMVTIDLSEPTADTAPFTVSTTTAIS